MVSHCEREGVMLTDWRDEVLGSLWSQESISPGDATPIALSLDLTFSIIIASIDTNNLTLARSTAGQYKVVYNRLPEDTFRSNIVGDFVSGNTVYLERGGDGVIFKNVGKKWQVLAYVGRAWGNIFPISPTLGSADPSDLMLSSVGNHFPHVASGGNLQLGNEYGFCFADTSGFAGSLTFENDGMSGQYKEIILTDGGNILTINSPKFKGFTSILLENQGDGVILYRLEDRWQVIRLLNDARKV